MEVPEIDEALLAFPTIDGCEDWVPNWEDIPTEYKNRSNPTKWNQLFSDMFFAGMKDLELIPKEGVEADKAWRALRALAGTFALSHEHKESSWAYLASCWFDDATWTLPRE